MPARPLSANAAARTRRVDAGLSAMLFLQGFTLFVALPLDRRMPGGSALLDLCHLCFAGVSIAVLARRRSVRVGLAAALVLLVLGPALAGRISARLALSAAAGHEVISLIAFTFNASVTALVARHVFAGGPVTAHRVRGAILLYLNVSALFAIAFAAVAMHDPAAFTSGRVGFEGAPAAFSYFSLATITTTGYGDIAPVHPLARSLANLEAVFGQLFPATLLSRLVGLQLAREKDDEG